MEGTKEKEEREPFRKERDPWRDYGLTGLACVMRSRWGPTSATRWQPPTSTAMGEWTQ